MLRIFYFFILVLFLNGCMFENLKKMEKLNKYSIPLQKDYEIANKQKILNQLVKNNSKYYYGDGCIYIDESFQDSQRYVLKYKTCYYISGNSLVNKDASYCVYYYSEGGPPSIGCDYILRAKTYMTEIEKLNRILPSILNEALNDMEDEKIQQAKIKEINDKIKEEQRIQQTKINKSFRKNIKRGDNTHCGLVTSIDLPLIKIQTTVNEKWMKLSDLYPEETEICPY